MPRMDISVHSKDKDQVKSLGAQWDAGNKIWYVPDGIDPTPFKQWFISPPSPINIRSSNFVVAVQKKNCFNYSAPVDVLTIILPSGWEEWEIVEETGEDAIMAWCPRLAPAGVHYVRLLPDIILSTIQSIVPYYKLGLINGHHYRAFFNYCKACGSLQKENVQPIYEKSGKPIEGITSHNFSQQFECSSPFQCDLRWHSFDVFATSLSYRN